MRQSPFHLKKEGSILWWEWNDHQASVNLISFHLLKEMESLISRLETEDIKALVLISGKSSNFIAGVDIKELQKINQKAEISRFLKKFHSFFNRLEKLPIVKIAAIHGACLGGGLELALTFDYRLASDSKETRLGLPETHLGLIPGLGGCIRLPRLISLPKSLEMILKGSALSSKQALSIGLIDEEPPQSILRKRAKELALRAEKNIPLYQSGLKFELLIKGKSQKNSNRISIKRFTSLKKNKSDFYIKNIPFAASILFYATKRKVLQKTKNLYPAPLAALHVIKKTYRLRNIEKALSIEQAHFLKLIAQKENKNLMRMFFLIRKAKKKRRTSKKFNIKNIAVIGAGIMGKGIAYACGSKNLSVHLMDNKETALSKALIEINRLWKKHLKKNPELEKAPEPERALQIFSTSDYKDCSHLDMIIEAVPEDEEIKKQVLQKIAPYLNEEAIFASNTSSLSLKKIASFYPYPHRVLGMHFFNPAYKMPLVEVIKTEFSEAAALTTALEFVKRIGKIPIAVKDSPGFLVNRLLAPYLCEALWLLEEGYDIAFVDQYFSKDFGMPMGPFQLMDEVGLDICLQVIDNLKNAGLPLDIPDETVTLFSKLGAGRKEGQGFYMYANQKSQSFFNAKLAKQLKTLPFFNTKPAINKQLKTPLFFNTKPAGRLKTLSFFNTKPAISRQLKTFFPKKSPDNIASLEEDLKRGLYLLINEGFKVLEENIVSGADDVDLGMILGIGFPPVYGGPLAYAKEKGLNSIRKNLELWLKSKGPRFCVSEKLKEEALIQTNTHPVSNQLS